MWSGQLYRVAARPLETDVAQPPVGAVIGIRALDRKYAQELVNTTQTNIVFYALGQRVAGAGVQGFDESLFDQIVPELAKLDTDPTYTTKGHSEIRDLSPTLGAVFAKLDGDAFELGGGFAVVRPRVTIQSGSAFLSSADETDRKNVSWPMLIGIVVAGLAFGLMLTFLEHDRPLRAFRDQASKLKQGVIDLLQLPQLGGPLRDIGADINAGIERVAEKGGGAPRKAADLEAIVGHAEPGMSAFAFPMAEPVSAVRSASAVSAPPASGPKPLPPNGPGLGIASIPTSPQPLVAKPVVPPAIASKPQVALPPLQQPETNPTAVMPVRQPDGPLANNRPGARSCARRDPRADPHGAASRRGRADHGRSPFYPGGPRAGERRGAKRRRGRVALGLRRLRQDEEAVRRADRRAHLRQVPPDAPQEPGCARAEAQLQACEVHRLREGRPRLVEGHADQGLMRKLGFYLAGVLVTTPALASNVTEFPDNGSEQMGRGGAWLARASDPLAPLYNPPGRAGPPTRLTLQANIPFSHTCFSRMRDPNDTTQDTVLLLPDGVHYPTVCNDLGTFPVPSLGMTIRATDRLGIGILITAPSGAAQAAWPEFVQTSSGQYYPAPERYIGTYANAFFLTPTIGVGWEPVDHLRIGASFIAGIANAQFSNGSMGNNGETEDPRSNDIKASLSSATTFVPGFTVGALWSASPMLDVAAWYKWSAPIDTSADVTTYANYYNLSTTVTQGNSALANGTMGSECSAAAPAGACAPGLGHIKLAIPMEAKIGLRLHKPRRGVALEGGDRHRRDPMAQDIWDLSLDLTWANDSAIDALNITFPGTSTVGTIPVAGTPGTVPPNASIPHNYNDVVGVRLGGDYNAVPNRLAIRAGAFFESQAASTDGKGNAPYMGTDFIAGARVGLALGATLRIPTKRNALPTEGGAIELSLGYMHMFVADLNNDAAARPGGIRALAAGTACRTGTPNGQGICSNGAPAFRSSFLANLGTISSSLDVINVGASYRF